MSLSTFKRQLCEYRTKALVQEIVKNELKGLSSLREYRGM